MLAPTRLSTLPASHSHSLSISPLFPSPSLAFFSLTLTLSVHLSPSPRLPLRPARLQRGQLPLRGPPAPLSPPRCPASRCLQPRAPARDGPQCHRHPRLPNWRQQGCKTAGRGQLVPPPHASRGRAANFFQTHNRHSPGTISNNLISAWSGTTNHRQQTRRHPSARLKTELITPAYFPACSVTTQSTAAATKNIRTLM